MAELNLSARTIWAAMIAGALMVCAGAGVGAQTNPPVAGAQGNAERDKPATLPPRMVTDEVGRQVAVPQPLRRVISLAPSVTETIYALGAQGLLVGDTDACNYPAAAQKLPKVGGPFTPNLEIIVAMKPDLVVVAANSGNRKETVDALDLLHVPTYAMNARTIDEVMISIEKLGDVLGASEQGKVVTEGLRTRLAELHRKLENIPSTRVLFVVWQEPLISIGQDTYIANALRYAGAESVLQTKQDWPRVGWEEVVRLQPTYLVFASAHPEEITTMVAGMKNQPGWRDLKAVSENKIAIISDAINLPAPRIVDAIEELARKLHPEAFVEAPRVPVSISQRTSAAVGAAEIAQ